MKTAKKQMIACLLLLFAALLVSCAPGESPNVPAKPVEQADPAPSPAASKTSGQKVSLELFVMSQCPFSKGAEVIVKAVMETLPGMIDLDIGYILNEGEGAEKFQSLHGAPEVELNRVQICAGIVNREKQLAFITAANQTTEDWRTVAKETGINVAEIEKCTRDGRADEVLARDAKRTKERGINASPTIFINGRQYQGQRSSLDLLSDVCLELGDGAPDACRNPPKTLSRSDGQSAAGKCGPEDTPQVDPSLVDEIKFTHTIIFSPDAFSDNIDQVVAETKRLFPKVKIEKLPETGAKAKELIARFGLEWLPAFIFPKTIEKAKNFPKIRGVFAPVGEGPEAYQLDPKQLGANFSLTRPAKPGTIEVFYTPFNDQALTIILDALDLLEEPGFAKYREKVSWKPAGQLDWSDKVNAQYGTPEVEEMERHIAILSSFGSGKFKKYLEARREDPVSSYWEDFLGKAGLPADKVKAAARSEQTRQKLKENSKAATELAIRGELAFLVNNREIAQVRDKADFRRLLEHVFK